jgi:hypothetical protein
LIPPLRLFIPALLAGWLSAGVPLPAQQPGSSLAQELALLGRTAAALEHQLPSFTCQETGTSEVLRGKKVLNRVAFQAAVRVRPDQPPGSLETVTVTELNGAPYRGGDYPFAFYVSGGFGQGMRYFAPAQQACYVYTLRPGRIDFVSAADLAGHPQCRDEGMRGFALLDPAGEVTHLERTVSTDAVRQYQLVPFSAIDFAPVELNGQTFLLSSHLHAEQPAGKMLGVFDVSYTGCRLFRVSVTVGPPTPAEPTGEPAPAAGPEPRGQPTPGTQRPQDR